MRVCVCFRMCRLYRCKNFNLSYIRSPPGGLLHLGLALEWQSQCHWNLAGLNKYLGKPFGLLQNDAFTRKSFHTQMSLHSEAFTRCSFYTQTLSRPDTLHTEAFTRKSLYAQMKVLQREPFTQTPLPRVAFRQAWAFAGNRQKPVYRYIYIYTCIYVRTQICILKDLIIYVYIYIYRSVCVWFLSRSYSVCACVFCASLIN